MHTHVSTQAHRGVQAEPGLGPTASPGARACIRAVPAEILPVGAPLPLHFASAASRERGPGRVAEPPLPWRLRNPREVTEPRRKGQGSWTLDSQPGPRPPSRKFQDGEEPAWSGLPTSGHQHCFVGFFTLTWDTGLHGLNAIAWNHMRVQPRRPSPGWAGRPHGPCTSPVSPQSGDNRVQTDGGCMWTGPREVSLESPGEEPPLGAEPRRCPPALLDSQVRRAGLPDVRVSGPTPVLLSPPLLSRVPGGQELSVGEGSAAQPLGPRGALHQFCVRPVPAPTVRRHIFSIFRYQTGSGSYSRTCGGRLG